MAISTVHPVPTIRIAYLIDTISSDTAGTQKQLLETIRRLEKKQFDPLLICLWQSPWMTQHSLPCPCKILDYRGFLKWNFPCVIMRLAKIIQEERVHILQTFFEDSIFVAYFARIISSRQFVLLSSRRDMGLGKGNQPWYHSLFKLALPWVNRHFDGIIANSEQVRSYVAKREKTSLGKIKVIRNGVRIPRSSPLPAAFYGIINKDCSMKIGHVGSLTPVKRHDILIKSLALVRQKDPHCDIEVFCLGEGSLRHDLQKLAERHGVREFVHFLGAVQDVAPFLYHFQVGVLCSDREGLSNAILEYMACGLPVVATAVGGNIEIVNSENGIVIPPNDSVALATALLHLAGNPMLRQRLGDAGLKKIQQSFSWQKTMEELETYYLQLVEDRL